MTTKPATKTIKSNLQYEFTQQELVELGKDLGESQLKLRQLDDDRKMVADEWKAKISSQEAHINSLSNKVSSGYEYRDIECTVTLNDPTPGQKTVRRNDKTGDASIVKIMMMDESEMQAELPLEGLADKLVEAATTEGTATHEAAKQMAETMGPGDSVTISGAGKSVTIKGKGKPE